MSGTLFEKQRPAVAAQPRAMTAAAPAPVPRGPTDAEQTAARLTRFRIERENVEHDARAARLRELRAEGLSLDAAFDQIEREQEHETIA